EFSFPLAEPAKRARASDAKNEGAKMWSLCDDPLCCFREWDERVTVGFVAMGGNYPSLSAVRQFIPFQGRHLAAPGARVQVKQHETGEWIALVLLSGPDDSLQFGIVQYLGARALSDTGAPTTTPEHVDVIGASGVPVQCTIKR